jgi:hypothetical protein
MRWAEGAVALTFTCIAACMAACTAWHPPELPREQQVIDPPPPFERVAEPPAPPDAKGAEKPAAEAPPSEGGAPAPPSTTPDVRIVIEAPYKLDQPPAPTSRQQYQADILERRRWNDGGLGELAADQPGPVGHPDPRVVVNVDAVRGPHEQATVQRLARKHQWIEIARCYRLGFHEDPELRGWTKARMIIGSNGRVRSTKLLDTELDREDVPKCMVDKLKKLRFPAARSNSRVDLSMRVGPGDDPVPPPDELLLAGKGKLEVAAMRRGVEAGVAQFEACYRAAFDYAPGLWGRIAIRFHLTEHGTLDEAFQVESRFPDVRVSQCVLRAARKLRFDAPKEGDIRFVVALRLWSIHASTAPGDPNDGATPPPPW